MEHDTQEKKRKDADSLSIFITLGAFAGFIHAVYMEHDTQAWVKHL